MSIVAQQSPSMHAASTSTVLTMYAPQHLEHLPIARNGVLAFHVVHLLLAGRGRLYL